MRLAQHRSRQPTQVAHPPTVLRVGHHWQRDESKEHGVQHGYMRACKREIVKTDKADRNIMGYVVIVLRVGRVTIPGKVSGLLWFEINHAML